MAIVLPKFPRGGLSTRGVTANISAIMIRLHGLHRGYMPSESLEFHYTVNNIDTTSISAIEASVVWFTEGKGSEDIGVHCFQRLTGDSITRHDWMQPMVIKSELPDAPLSYEGTLVKIRWCIRVRVYLVDGTEMVAQEPFYLGSITKEV